MKQLFSIPVFCFCALALFAQCKTKKSATGTGAQTNNTVKTTNTTNKKVSPLDGSWQFSYFTTVNTAKNILFPLHVPNLVFDTKQGSFNGNGACNNISGRFEVSENSMRFVLPLLITRMACNAMGEKMFIQYLEAVTGYTVSGNTLQLIVGDKPAMVFTRE